MKKYIAWLLVALALVPSTMSAYTAIHGQDQVRIDKNIEDNVYVAGGKVDVTANVSGDLFLAGGELTVTGNIGDNGFVSGGNIETSGRFDDDLFVAGGNVRIRGPVAGDIKAAGGNVSLESSGSGDVNMAGGSIRIAKESRIEKDLGMAGGNVVFSGLVKGKADFFAETLDLDGTIEKDAKINVESAQKLRIGPNAKILGKLTYTANERIPELEKIAVGGAQYDGKSVFSKAKDDQTMLFGLVSTYLVYRLLFLLIVGGLLLFFFRKSIGKIANAVRTVPGKSFLYGVLYFVLMPIAIVVCFITVVGIPLGFLALAIYVFSFVFSKLLTLVVFSELITNKWGDKLQASWQKWGVFALLAIVITLVSGVDFLAALFAFGALAMVVGNGLSKASA